MSKVRSIVAQQRKAAEAEAKSVVNNDNKVITEAPEEFDVIKNAEGVKQHDKKPTTKPTPKPKEVKAPLLTLWEVMGITMKANPDASKEVIIKRANSLYSKKTGKKESNLFQITKYYHFASLILKGYNAK
jgi:hypothetical protein